MSELLSLGPAKQVSDSLLLPSIPVESAQNNASFISDLCDKFHIGANTPLTQQIRNGAGRVGTPRRAYSS
jgi:AMMECR1 domain-containing protein